MLIKAYSSSTHNLDARYRLFKLPRNTGENSTVTPLAHSSLQLLAHLTSHRCETHFDGRGVNVEGMSGRSCGCLIFKFPPMVRDFSGGCPCYKMVALASC